VLKERRDRNYLTITFPYLLY